jgi:POT family proton-dependent oligopeptide transporter
MRSLVNAFYLFMSAISAAIGFAFVGLSTNPLLVWNYGGAAIISFVGGCLFWLQNRKLDRHEDVLNMLPTGHVGTTEQAQELDEQVGSADEKKAF